MTISQHAIDTAAGMPLNFDFRDTGRLRAYSGLLFKLCRVRRLPAIFEDVVDDAQRCFDWRIDNSLDPIEIAARLQHLADCITAHWCLGKSASGLTENELFMLANGFRSLSVALILHVTPSPASYYARPGEAWWLPDDITDVEWPEDDYPGDLD